METRRKFMVNAVTVSAATAAGFALSSTSFSSKAVAAAAVSKSEPTTQENLMNAFAGESQANRKYVTFAEQADKEGLKQTAKLFRAIAAAETIHAMSHLHYAGNVGNTMENLKTAMEGETYEFTKMYPPMADKAGSEGKRDIQEYFDWAKQVEEGHAKMYQKAIEAEGKLAEADYYLCSICGYTHEGRFKGDCPVCGVPDTNFFKFT